MRTHLPSQRFWITAVLILLAYGLRVHNLDASGFWTDEGLVPLRSGYSIAKILSGDVEIQGVVTTDTHPPLFYLLIHFTRRLWGESDFAYRYLSVLAGTLLVPLLYQFGRRMGYGTRISRMNADKKGNPAFIRVHPRPNELLGLLVGLLTAVNPTQIYYAHEARMYTLLVLFAAAASYILWRAAAGGMLPKKQLLAYLGLYFLWGAAAAYTQYTAVILIAAQAPFWVWILWKNGYKKLIAGTAVLAAVAAIPLLWIIIPRLFTGPEADFRPVSPLIMLHDVVRGFGLGITTDFNSAAAKVLDIGLFALLIIGVAAARSWLKRSFLLVYLLAAVGGLMLGSWLVKPMYQGARHIMVGSPAFLLLIGYGIMGIGAYKKNDPQISQITQIGRKNLRNLRNLRINFLAILALLIPLTASLLALNNLYNDPDYRKNDFRALIAYIEQRAGGNDVVVYNNAILLPLHDHYSVRADLPVTASPSYPWPGERVAPDELAALAEEYGRIWFVTNPPAANRDVNKVAETWLDDNLTVVDVRNEYGRTSEVKTIAYAVPAGAYAAAEPLDVAWEKLPHLNGVRLNFEQPAALPTLWFDLLWEAEAPIVPALLRFSLRGADGRIWASQDLDLTNADGRLRAHYYLPLPAGTPPGIYTLLAQPMATAEGPILGEERPLAEIELAPSAAAAPPSDLPSLQFDNGIRLDAIIIADDGVKPGHNLPLALYWRSDGAQALENIAYTLDVFSDDGALLRTQTNRPGAEWLTGWPPDTVIKENTGLYIHPDTPPGSYRLRWQLFDGDTAVAGRPSWRPWSTEKVILGEITVEEWPFVGDAPAMAHEVDADFGGAATLLGYDWDETAVPPQLTLHWQSQIQPAENYAVFIHVLDADGNVVAQTDGIPVGGLRPTKGWRPDEILSDTHTLPIPPDTPSGSYKINVGLYNPDDGARLPITLNGEPQADNQLTIIQAEGGE